GICKIRSMSGNPDRLQFSRRSRGQFDSTYEGGRPPTCKKLQVELPIRRGAHILECSNINCGGTGVCDWIEFHQQRMPIQIYLKIAAILRILLVSHIRPSEGIGEIEPQFVNSRRRWNVVTELTLRLRDHHAR